MCPPLEVIHYRICWEMLKIISVIDLCKSSWQMESKSHIHAPKEVTVTRDNVEVKRFTLWDEEFIRLLQVPKVLKASG